MLVKHPSIVLFLAHTVNRKSMTKSNTLKKWGYSQFIIFLNNTVHWKKWVYSQFIIFLNNTTVNHIYPTFRNIHVLWNFNTLDFHGRIFTLYNVSIDSSLVKCQDPFVGIFQNHNRTRSFVVASYVQLLCPFLVSIHKMFFI